MGNYTPDQRLVGWKAIADHFGKTVRTIQRWERSERLPVHRHLHGVQSTVYAYREELDAWLSARNPESDRRWLSGSGCDIGDVSRLCSLARYHWALRTSDGFERSILLAREALRRNPSCAIAHGVLARSLITLASYGHVSPSDYVRQAIGEATRAIVLDSQVVEAYQALGLGSFFRRDWNAAKDAFESALRVDADDPTSYQWFSIWHLVRSSRETACLMSTHAEALDPRAPILSAHTSWVLLMSGYVEEAIAKAKSVVERAPHFWRGYWNLAVALIAADRPQDAADALAVAGAMSPHRHNSFVHVHALARAGFEKEAELLFRRELSEPGYASPYWKAYVYMGFGAFDEAVSALGESLAQQEWFVIFMKVDPIFERLRGRQNFEALCRAADLA